MFSGLAKVTQGSVGLSYAIAFYTREKYNVSVPLVDNQNYDLIVETMGELSSVQVKTTGYRKKDTYIVQLKSVRSNKKTNKINNFDPSKVKRLFVLIENGDIYDIPCSEISAKTALTLTEKYDVYKHRL